MLQDHFHPPLSLRRHWHAFHNAWATYISSALNANLPAGYFAEPNVQFGIEIDVATFEDQAPQGLDASGNGAEQNSTEPGRPWSPGPPTLTIPITILTDVAEVLVYADQGGPTLAGAIELVSPANKDRQAQRDALVYKCVAYLQQGIGLLLVDVVTDRKANLHDELLARLHKTNGSLHTVDLYAVSYRPVQREEETLLDTWIEILALGHALPTLPLWLRGSISVPVDLEMTYNKTCTELRVLTGSGG